MTDYWDFVSNMLGGSGGDLTPWGIIKGLYSDYEKAYDESHGEDRYWLSKVPGFSWYKRMKDEAKAAQDYWVNTGKDPAYIQRIHDGTGLGPLDGMVGKAVRMARSLDTMYVPEVIENLETKFNGAYR